MVEMPSHPLPPNPIFCDKVINASHESNKHYDGTLNNMHFFSFATEIASNEVFTFHQAMKQEDRALFIEAMEKEETG